MNEDLNGIEALSYELRKFPPSSDFVAQAHVSDESKWRIAILISKNDDPQVRAIPMERSQSSGVKDA